MRPEQLRDRANYTLIKVLRHDEIIEFVLAQLGKLRWPMLIFYGLTLFMLIRIMAITLTNILYNHIPWGLYWQFLLTGVISGMLLVIPFHELLHGLAYRLAGAKKVKYGADLKQMLFYASAPGFVTGRSAFYFVAFCPFIILNLLFLSGILWGTEGIRWGALVALFVHTTMCIGDFAMANFFAAYPEQKVYTYDEDKTGVSYFYLEVKQTQN
jgi:hypothetical protein